MASAANNIDPNTFQNVSDAFINGMQAAVLCAISLVGIGGHISLDGGSDTDRQQ